MADSVNMSLDDIIKQNKHQNRASRSRGRGSGGIVQTRGNIRGGGRGGGRGRGRGRGGGRGRGRSQSRPGTPGARQTRSRSRGPQGRSQSRSRSQSRTRSRSRQQRRSVSRGRSASRSRSQLRITPKGRAGLEDLTSNMPQLVRGGGFKRGGWQHRLRSSNSNPNLQGIHTRLGININRGGFNNRRPLAVAKRGISKRGRGMTTNTRYSAVGLRSDQILKEQRQHLIRHNNMIRSQTFTRSRNNSFNASQLTVSVANDFTKRRRNSVGNAGYLNQQSLAQLNNEFGAYTYNTRRGPGSAKSMGSNRSNRSSRSNVSNASRRSTRSRGRGRGGNRGIGRKFVNKQVLNPKLQKEIAAIQGKSYGNNNNTNPAEAPEGISFTPTPAATGQSLHQRFGST